MSVVYPPTYPTTGSESGNEKWNIEEKQGPTTSCPHHAATEASVLNAHFEQAEAKACMHALSTALSDTANSRGCLKCTIKDTVHMLTVYARDYKANRKNEPWSKEEKKAMKAEVKAFFGEIKRDVKETWNAKA